MSTIKNISDIYAIKRIITKLTGKQVYCGMNFLNTIYIYIVNFSNGIGIYQVL